MSDVNLPRVQWTLFINSPKACSTALIKGKGAEDQIKFTRTMDGSIKAAQEVKRIICR